MFRRTRNYVKRTIKGTRFWCSWAACCIFAYSNSECFDHNWKDHRIVSTFLQWIYSFVCTFLSGTMPSISAANFSDTVVSVKTLGNQSHALPFSTVTAPLLCTYVPHQCITYQKHPTILTVHLRPDQC